MGLLDRFRRKNDEPLEVDPLQDLVLEKLKVGYLVDYDLKTWRVTGQGRYRFNDGRTSDEWELTEGHDKRYLELARGDGTYWSLSKTIPIGAIGGDVRQHILEHDDPPDEVVYQGSTYYLEGSVGGGYTEPGDGRRRDLILWEFADEDEESFLSILQWSETEFSAASGVFVEEYQFTNILPGTE